MSEKFRNFTVQKLSYLVTYLKSNEPHCEKTGIRGFRPGLTHHHHIRFRACFPLQRVGLFEKVFLKDVLSTQNDFEGQQSPYLASFCHSSSLHPMISLACQIISVQPHSACVLLKSTLCCTLHVQTISFYWHHI